MTGDDSKELSKQGRASDLMTTKQLDAADAASAAVTKRGANDAL